MILMRFFLTCSLYSSVDDTPRAHVFLQYVSQLLVFCLDLHSPGTVGHGDQLCKKGNI